MRKLRRGLLVVSLVLGGYLLIAYRPTIASLEPSGTTLDVRVEDPEWLQRRLEAERAQTSAQNFAVDLGRADSTDFAPGRELLVSMVRHWLELEALAEFGQTPAESLLGVRSDSIAMAWLRAGSRR